ncbi:MAG: DUF4340 domain-containing protein [Rhodospirillales bacterium]
MSPKTFIALSVVTAIAVVAAAFAVTRDRGFTPVAGAGEIVFPGLIDRVNDVASMVVELPGGRIAIEHGKNGWTVKENDDYPARAVKVRQVILALAQLKLLEPKTRSKDKLSKLELQDPDVKGAQSKRVKLFDGAGKPVADVILGRRRQTLPGTTLGGVYLRRPGDAQTWLAAGGPDVTDERRDWLERKIIDIDGTRVKKVVIRHPDGETVTISRPTPETKDFVLENIPAGKKLISQPGVNYVGEVLGNLLLDDVRKSADSFDAQATVTAGIATFDGLTVQVLVSKRDGKHWIRLDASAADAEAKTKDGKPVADEAKEILARTGGWTYQISDYAASNLTKRYQNLVEDKKSGS